MSPTDAVRVGRLVDLLAEPARSEDSQVSEARELLAGLSPDDELAVARTEVENLRRSYRRRAARSGADPAVLELSAIFDAWTDPEVTSVAASVEGRMVYLWFDSGLSTLVACYVGTDRRVDP